MDIPDGSTTTLDVGLEGQAILATGGVVLGVVITDVLHNKSENKPLHICTTFEKLSTTWSNQYY